MIVVELLEVAADDGLVLFGHALLFLPSSPSARSGDIFGNSQMLVMRTVEGSAHAICQFVGAEQTVGLHHPSFAVDPLRLYRVEPRALLGKQAGQDAYPAPAPLDLPVVGGIHSLTFLEVCQEALSQ